MLFTLGHGNRSLEACLELLRGAGVKAVVDVRRHPVSGRFPHFSEEPLRAALEAEGMVYHWAGRQLGGRREPRPDSPHTALEGGMRGYADHMETAAFQKGIAQLLNLAGRTPTAILCAERDPDRCHRSLIADYVTVRGVRVFHLIAPGPFLEHRLHPMARVEGERLLYDRVRPLL
ncbi:MAG: DUF488 domain-containing protein [Gammaproteobacteria bacterium]|nr:MAG: DUF488 domain-containing protein [Gammaproteobacteria bacterium]